MPRRVPPGPAPSRLPPTTLLAALAALAGCAAAPTVPARFAELLADAPEGQPVRFLAAGDAIVAVAVPLGPGMLPPPVRVAIDAVAPGGEWVFAGREQSQRGDGFRIEKVLRNGAVETVREALIAPDGRVLERAHSVPIAAVPQDVLATALRQGPTVTEVRIVSGPAREECFRCTVSDHAGRTFVVTTGLDGSLRGTARRLSARVDG